MNLQLSAIYSFEVYPFAIYGTKFKNAKLLSTLDPSTAQALGLDIRARHAQVYPTLPASTPNDPTQYNYARFELPSGQTEIIGLPWIIENTLETVSLGKHFVEVDNSASTDSQKIINALAANGIKVSKIQFKAATPQS